MNFLFTRIVSTFILYVCTVVKFGDYRIDSKTQRCWTVNHIEFLSNFLLSFFSGLALRDLTVVLSTSTSQPMEQKSVAPSEVRSTQAVAESLARTPGSSTCVARPAPSTTPKNCLWLRASSLSNPNPGWHWEFCGLWFRLLDWAKILNLLDLLQCFCNWYV